MFLSLQTNHFFCFIDPLYCSFISYFTYFSFVVHYFFLLIDFFFFGSLSLKCCGGALLHRFHLVLGIGKFPLLFLPGHRLSENVSLNLLMFV